MRIAVIAVELLVAPSPANKTIAMMKKASFKWGEHIAPAIYRNEQEHSSNDTHRYSRRAIDRRSNNSKADVPKRCFIKSTNMSPLHRPPNSSWQLRTGYGPRCLPSSRSPISIAKGVLVDPAVLHDDLEVLGGVGDQVDILQRIAVDQQQIGKRALFHDAELAWIRTALAGQCQ